MNAMRHEAKIESVEALMTPLQDSFIVINPQCSCDSCMVYLQAKAVPKVSQSHKGTSLLYEAVVL
jgi:hypothetical protein